MSAENDNRDEVNRWMQSGYVRLDKYAQSLAIHPRTLKRRAQEGKFPAPLRWGRYLWVKKVEADDAIRRLMRSAKEMGSLVDRFRANDGRFAGGAT